MLINNAGAAAMGAEEEVPIESAKKVFETSFFGLVRMTNAVLPHMRQRRNGLIFSLSRKQPQRYSINLSNTFDF